MEESWAKIDGFEYEVSSLGRVRSLPRVIVNNVKGDRLYGGKILTPVKHKNGYLFVTLCNGFEKKTCSIHRLVAQAHVDNPYNKPQVNHKDGDRSNNVASNLEWVTAQENIRHAFDELGKAHVNSGSFKPGMIQKTRKLSDEQVRQIRADTRKAHVIAKEVGVDRKCIWLIKNYKTYRDVT